MLFNKDSKIVKMSASAEGYYSGATAYGEFYITNDLYINKKNELKLLTVYVGELDGKHSETECNIEFEELTIEDILKMENMPHGADRDITESLFFTICDGLELTDAQSEMINNFSNELLSLDKILPVETVTVILEESNLIQGVMIPKGTEIKFTKNTNRLIPEDWSWEFNFEEL